MIVGLLADPEGPADLAEKLASELSTELTRSLGGEGEWRVEVLPRPFSAGEREDERLLEAVREYKRREGWDYAIALTDLPLRTGRGPLVTDVDVDAHGGVALVSLPALGGLFLERRTRKAILRLIRRLHARKPEERDVDAESFGPLLGETRAPFRRTSPDESAVDVRYVASPVRGRVRLLVGMVRANRPWRLVVGLSSALAAALATAAIALVNQSVWQLSDALETPKLVIAAVGAVAILVTWLIVDHDLWESSSGDAAQDREQSILYNASTVITLALGVFCMYVGLFAINLSAAAFVIDLQLMGEVLGHPAGASELATLAWMATSASVVGGALGSSLESDEAVIAAAYGERERERRKERRRHAEEAEAGAS